MEHDALDDGIPRGPGGAGPTLRRSINLRYGQFGEHTVGIICPLVAEAPGHRHRAVEHKGHQFLP